jgi:hypothetical protein
VLASYLNPIIKRHSTPKDAYEQAKDIDPEDDLTDANELYTMDATDLWPDTNARPEWATGLDEVHPQPSPPDHPRNRAVRGSYLRPQAHDYKRLGANIVFLTHDRHGAHHQKMANSQSETQ